MSDTDYSLAHISQVVESENAKVLSSFITSNANSKVLELTLKINRIDLGRILRALERYDYKVKASFQRNSYHEDLDRKSTRLNSSHVRISYAVFCLKKKKKKRKREK